MNASAHDNKNGKTRGRIKRAIARTAPSLARALGGPLAGAAVEQLSRAIFGDAAVDEEALADALAAATPEQLLAIKKAIAEETPAAGTYYPGSDDVIAALIAAVPLYIPKSSLQSLRVF